MAMIEKIEKTQSELNDAVERLLQSLEDRKYIDKYQNLRQELDKHNIIGNFEIITNESTKVKYITYHFNIPKDKKESFSHLFRKGTIKYSTSRSFGRLKHKNMNNSSLINEIIFLQKKIDEIEHEIVLLKKPKKTGKESGRPSFND